jgi:hypothetical protein
MELITPPAIAKPIPTLPVNKNHSTITLSFSFLTNIIE